MDEDTSPAPDTGTETGSAEPTAPAEDTGTDTGTDSTANDSDSTISPEATNDQPTVPPQTPDENTPDQGVDPDKGIDPDAGDEPTDKTDNELKNMTRAERAAYYQNLEREQQKQVAQAIDAAYQPQNVDELKQAYLNAEDEYGNRLYNEFEATMLAERQVEKQQAQINAAKTGIAEVNFAIQTDAVEIMSTMPWTASKDPEDQAITKLAGDFYDQHFTAKDPKTGQIIDTAIPLKDWYGLVDQIRGAGAKQAGLKAQRAAEQQMAAVAPPTSTTRSRETPFSDLSTAQRREKLRAQGIYVT